MLLQNELVYLIVLTLCSVFFINVCYNVLFKATLVNFEIFSLILFWSFFFSYFYYKLFITYTFEINLGCFFILFLFGYFVKKNYKLLPLFSLSLHLFSCGWFFLFYIFFFCFFYVFNFFLVTYFTIFFYFIKFGLSFIPFGVFCLLSLSTLFHGFLKKRLIPMPFSAPRGSIYGTRIFSIFPTWVFSHFFVIGPLFFFLNLNIINFLLLYIYFPRFCFFYVVFCCSIFALFRAAHFTVTEKKTLQNRMFYNLVYFDEATFVYLFPIFKINLLKPFRLLYDNLFNFLLWLDYPEDYIAEFLYFCIKFFQQLVYFLWPRKFSIIFLIFCYYYLSQIGSFYFYFFSFSLYILYLLYINGFKTFWIANFLSNFEENSFYTSELYTSFNSMLKTSTKKLRIFDIPLIYIVFFFLTFSNGLLTLDKWLIYTTTNIRFFFDNIKVLIFKISFPKKRIVTIREFFEYFVAQCIIFKQNYPVLVFWSSSFFLVFVNCIFLFIIGKSISFFAIQTVFGFFCLYLYIGFFLCIWILIPIFYLNKEYNFLRLSIIVNRHYLYLPFFWIGWFFFFPFFLIISPFIFFPFLVYQCFYYIVGIVSCFCFFWVPEIFYFVLFLVLFQFFPQFKFFYFFTFFVCFTSVFVRGIILPFSFLFLCFLCYLIYLKNYDKRFYWIFDFIIQLVLSFFYLFYCI